MTTEYSYNPDWAIPPSETLQEVLEDKNMTLQTLSDQSGVPYQSLSEVLEVKRPIDESIAEGLEKALQIPASFWLKLEKNYQDTVKRLATKKD